MKKEELLKRINEKKLKEVLKITLNDVYNIKNLTLGLDKGEITFIAFPLNEYDKNAIKEIIKDIF